MARGYLLVSYSITLHGGLRLRLSLSLGLSPRAQGLRTALSHIPNICIRVLYTQYYNIIQHFCINIINNNHFTSYYIVYSVQCTTCRAGRPSRILLLVTVMTEVLMMMVLVLVLVVQRAESRIFNLVSNNSQHSLSCLVLIMHFSGLANNIHLLYYTRTSIL